MSVRDYVEHLKSKPEHVRQQVALGASFGVAALVFAGWAAVLATSGRLALSGGAPEAVPAAVPAADSLAGAAAAFSSAFSGEGSVTAVETKASTTLDQSDTGEATVIPF